MSYSVKMTVPNGGLFVIPDWWQHWVFHSTSKYCCDKKLRLLLFVPVSWPVHHLVCCLNPRRASPKTHNNNCNLHQCFVKFIFNIVSRNNAITDIHKYIVDICFLFWIYMQCLPSARRRSPIASRMVEAMFLELCSIHYEGCSIAGVQVNRWGPFRGNTV